MQTPAPSAANLQLYDHLLRFQFFQGLSRSELMLMAGGTKFGFAKHEAGRPIVRQGSACHELLLLIGGTMAQSTRSADGGYTLTEHVAAPWVVQPEALFGAQPRYQSTCLTLTPCHFITLSKDEVLHLLDNFLIVRLNYLNMLATLAQKRHDRQWRSAPLSLRDRFARFLLDHALYPAGPKELRILMTRLAQELGDSRINVSRMLNRLQADGLAQLHRGRIGIPSLEKLLTSG